MSAEASPCVKNKLLALINYSLPYSISWRTVKTNSYPDWQRLSLSLVFFVCFSLGSVSPGWLDTLGGYNLILMTRINVTTHRKCVEITFPPLAVAT